MFREPGLEKEEKVEEKKDGEIENGDKENKSEGDEKEDKEKVDGERRGEEEEDEEEVAKEKTPEPEDVKPVIGMLKIFVLKHIYDNLSECFNDQIQVKVTRNRNHFLLNKLN